MENPWKEIDLNDYENHMKLHSIQQLQMLNSVMNNQFFCYPVSSVMILGIAGGNGLEHISKDRFSSVFGVDINSDYLNECCFRYPSLAEVFHPIQADLTDENIALPHADLVIANLFIEYIGYDHFKRAIETISPQIVSAVIQLNPDVEFVSDSPYLHAFDRLEEVHHQLSVAELTLSMKEIGYQLISQEETPLPNAKKLLRLDYQRQY